MKREHILRYIASDVWLIEYAQLAAIVEVVLHGPIVADFPKVQHEATESPKGLALIPVTGTISPKANMMTALSGGSTAVGLENAVLAAANDPNVSSIILDLDTPGGFVEGIEEAAAVIRDVGRSKAVIGVMNHQASSGGYWTGSACTKLYASPSSKGGSIGVATVHTWQDEANKESKHEILTIGERKLEVTPFGPLSDAAKAGIMENMQGVYDRFVGAVAQHRNTTIKNVIDNFGKGASLPAPKMAELGMVDDVKSLRQVVMEELQKVGRKTKFQSYLDGRKQTA